MAQALRNYDQLLNAMGEANADKTAKLASIHATKANIDSTAKILGETKIALSGMSAQKAIGKNIIKPYLKKKFEEYKAKKSQRGGGDNEGNENAGPESGARENSNDLGGDQDASPAYTEDGNAASSSAEQSAASTEADEINETVARGASRVEQFESKVANGEAEGTEVAPNASEGAALARANGVEDAPESLEDWSNTNATGFEQAKTSFTDDDLGQEGEQVYDRANGLNPEESEQVSNYLNKSVTKQGPSGEPPTEEEAAASRTGQTSGSLEEGIGKTAIKKTAKDVGDDVGEDVGELGGEEGSLGILDAIPGADIFGVIAGAVLAGIEAHKEKKEEAAMEAAPPAPTVADNVGIGGSESNQ